MLAHEILLSITKLFFLKTRNHVIAEFSQTETYGNNTRGFQRWNKKLQDQNYCLPSNILENVMELTEFQVFW